MVTRIISAAIGIVIAIVVLILHATPVFNLVVAVLAVIMLYELLSANKCLQYKFHSGVCFAFAAAMPFLLEYTEGMEIIYIFGTSCILLLFAGSIAKHKEITFEKVAYMFTVTLLTTLPMCCLISLENADELHGVCYIV
ncbi:MAG: hypothetical protein K2G04_00465, partial [Oscillospiraceae bacterium]|nr:hypothetical protein [Oscillospiraceae bacterium]